MDDPEITLLLSSLDGGGAHHMMLQIARGLTHLNHSVEIVTIRNSGEFANEVPQMVNVVELDTNRALTSAPAIARYLNNKSPAAFLASPTDMTIIAVCAKFISSSETQVALRVPTTLSKELIFDNPSGIKNRLYVRFIKTLYPRADDIIAVSEGVADDLIQEFGMSKNNISVIYNPTVSDDLFDRYSEEPNHPFYQDSYPVIIGVGRLVEEKGFEALIKAFNRVISMQNARLIILGEGEKRNKLEDLTERLGITSEVSMPGFIKNPYPYIHHADMFVLSSRWEGCPNVLIESLACGTPVVSTDCDSGPREILEGGKYGELVPVGDSEAMADAIQKSIYDSTDSDELRSRAQDFHIREKVPEYEDVLLNGTV